MSSSTWPSALKAEADARLSKAPGGNTLPSPTPSAAAVAAAAAAVEAAVAAALPASVVSPGDERFSSHGALTMSAHKGVVRDCQIVTAVVEEDQQS